MFGLPECSLVMTEANKVCAEWCSWRKGKERQTRRKTENMGGLKVHDEPLKQQLQVQTSA